MESITAWFKNQAGKASSSEGGAIIWGNHPHWSLCPYVYLLQAVLDQGQNDCEVPQPSKTTDSDLCCSHKRASTPWRQTQSESGRASSLQAIQALNQDNRSHLSEQHPQTAWYGIYTAQTTQNVVILLLSLILSLITYPTCIGKVYFYWQFYWYVTGIQKKSTFLPVNTAYGLVCDQYNWNLK